MPVSNAIRIFAGLLALLGALNLILMLLADFVQDMVPYPLKPVTSFTDALLLFAVGGGVYMLAVIGLGKMGGKH